MPRAAATTAAARIPTIASSRRSVSGKARSATNSETVKPSPESAAPPHTLLSGTPGGSEPIPSFTASAAAPPTPTSLPTTRAVNTPRVIGEVTARASRSVLKWTPALARANTGTTTYPLHGTSSAPIRSLGEMARSTESLAWRARETCGDCRKARASMPADSPSARRGG